jgi:hypothetical protein
VCQPPSCAKQAPRGRRLVIWCALKAVPGVSFALTAARGDQRIDQSVRAVQLLSCDQMTAYLKRLQGSQEEVVSTEAAVNLQAPAPGMMLLKKKGDDLLDTMFAGAALQRQLGCIWPVRALRWRWLRPGIDAPVGQHPLHIQHRLHAVCWVELFWPTVSAAFKRYVGQTM